MLFWSNAKRAALSYENTGHHKVVYLVTTNFASLACKSHGLWWLTDNCATFLNENDLLRRAAEIPKMSEQHSWSICLFLCPIAYAGLALFGSVLFNSERSIHSTLLILESFYEQFTGADPGLGMLREFSS